MKKPLRIAWFSAGVSSAVATKLAIGEIDEIVYTHMDDQHPDTLRFVDDCTAWFGQPVTVIQSPLKSVENAVLAAGGRGYINGPGGAACTLRLKRRVRKEWERAHEGFDLTYFWGMDASEADRCGRLIEGMPMQQHRFPLVEHRIDKKTAHEMLRASGIKRPAMYDLGYHNNNCVGCVKGGMGYWNRIRRDFPTVFNSRALLERQVRASCIRGVYLDELDPERGRHEPPIVDDCGIMCEFRRLT